MSGGAVSRTKAIKATIALSCVLLIAAACAEAPSPEPVTPGNGVDGIQVEIIETAFEPPLVEIDIGDQITWINLDDEPHTVTGDGGLSSPRLDRGASYSASFDEPGRYDYVCSIHPTMRGSIIVRE
jgi:plastocyanin